MQVRNQSYLRRKNKNSIIELLRKKTQSYSDLARELKLSNTAIANIVDDLISENVVYRESDSKGRGGINLSINADYGYVVAVDLSRWQIILSAADFGSNILTTATIDDITFKKGDIEKIVAAVEALTKREELKGRALRCIAVASPGKIDKKSGKFILNPRFREIGNISLQAVFEEAFGCKVVIKNDINLALLGEKMYGGVLKNVQNALMLHVDVGMGAALLIDGKVYEGSHGFAGEIGYFKLNMLLSDENNYGNLNYGNYYDSTSLFSVLSIVKREISLGTETVLKDWLEASGRSWDDVTIDELLKAYRLKDALVVRAIHSAARVIGTFASSMSDFLDLDTVILIGSVTGLGKEYLKYISKYAKNCPVVFSDLGSDATIMGTINAGILAVFDGLL